MPVLFCVPVLCTVVCLYEALFQLEHLAVEDASSLLGLIKVRLLFCNLSLGSIAL